MSLARWSLYMNRSSQILRDKTSSILRMQGADLPSRAPMPLLTFNSQKDIDHIATGCDGDIGGTSTVHFELDQSTESKSSSNTKQSSSLVTKPTAKFWGEMRLAVRPGFEEKVRGGYAGFRSKPRPTLFGEMTEDVSNYRYLALRLRARGHPRTRNSYFVNLQTDGPITSDLWQHRIFFNRDDGDWEDVFIPFDRFVLTNTGEISSTQISMFKERIRTIGISLLGGNSGVEGLYELGIDSIHAVNKEDVTVEPKLEGTDGTQWERQAV
ncbi:complex I intermediate-associated protein CIA30 [Abortiporus biennis]|nr:complex I intermediate-associated protein CIA30 [Abortiporus biennis]